MATPKKCESARDDPRRVLGGLLSRPEARHPHASSLQRRIPVLEAVRLPIQAGFH